MIYLIKAEETNLYKIGYTAGKSKNRIKAMQTGCPHKLLVVEEVAGAVEKEKWLHKSFSEYRKQGEWFEFDEQIIDSVLDKMKQKHTIEDDTTLEDWRVFHEKHIRDSKSVDYRMEYFIELAILEIMSGNNDTAIQRLTEFKTILFGGGNLSIFPSLTERILNID